MALSSVSLIMLYVIANLNHGHEVLKDDYNIQLKAWILANSTILPCHEFVSLQAMLRRRLCLTENEVRYFLKQIVLGCSYLHRNKVIHHDLKLQNLFINDDMEVKIGDFGLAARIDSEGERLKTFCGTADYLAPEMVTGHEHSYEVDVWALGCIMYFLLVGSQPFQTGSVNETYFKIKRCDYSIPPRISKSARTLIQKMLCVEPSSRPTMEEILSDEFFISGYLPETLPRSCLTTPPRFSTKRRIETGNVTTRKPLTERNIGLDDSGVTLKRSNAGKPAVMENDDAEVVTVPGETGAENA